MRESQCIDPIQEEGVPQRRGADQRVMLEEEAPRATVMTPERVLALLGQMNVGDQLAQALAEAVEIEVRRALGVEQRELLDVVRMLAAVAFWHNQPHGTKTPHDPLGVGYPVEVHHPLHQHQLMVRAAQRLCLQHGFDRNGRDAGVEQPALNPEHMLERVEKSHRDYGNTYRWLLAESQRAGFTHVCDAIALAAQIKKGGAQ